jgi:hypothetical protein
MCLTSPDTCSIWENSAFKRILTAMGATQTRGDGRKYELFWGLNISDIITLRQSYSGQNIQIHALKILWDPRTWFLNFNLLQNQ